DRALRLRADHRRGRLTVLEEDHRRDRGDAVPLLELVLGVDVDLDELQLRLALGRDAVEHRGDGVARATPLGPEVDENGLLALDDLLVEGLGRHVECHWSFRSRNCNCKYLLQRRVAENPSLESPHVRTTARQAGSRLAAAGESRGEGDMR